MKKITTFFLLLALTGNSKAQDFDEWFRQKKTQLSYLRQQIAALEACIKVTESGYDIAKKGTSLITGITSDDYSQHNSYFTSLLNVRASIGQSPTVKAIDGLQKNITAVAAQAKQQATALPSWTPTINAFFQSLLEECSADLTWLNVLTTNGQVQLNDGERNQAIDKVCDRMKQRYEAALRARNAIVLFCLNQPS